LTIAPIRITFVDNGPEGDGRPHTIETEALAVTVASVVESATPSLDDLKPASGPVPLPGSSLAAWGALAALGALAATTIVVVRWLRQEKVIAATYVSPRQRARDELDELEREDLASPDYKHFYVRLTGIVRRYIEATTGIRAPEQTTEEFLRECEQNSRFSAAGREQLRSFLESADLVKYAALQPGAHDVAHSLASARVFLGLEAKEPTP
jgi:hypothetical protein